MTESIAFQFCKQSGSEKVLYFPNGFLTSKYTTSPSNYSKGYVIIIYMTSTKNFRNYVTYEVDVLI